MTEPIWLGFISGLIVMGFLVAAVFFLRFWRRTKDSLFAVFAAAFALLALNAAVVPLSGVPREEASGFYLIRLSAFVLLIVAILIKNAGGRPKA